MKIEHIIIAILLVIIVLLLFGGFFFFYEAQFMSGRANVVNTSFSADNSYVIPIPAQAKADGSEKIRITVFVLNGQGLGVMGKKITISNPDQANMVIEQIQPITDSFGKAYFDVASKKPGLYYSDVSVDGVQLSQKASLNFK